MSSAPPVTPIAVARLGVRLGFVALVSGVTRAHVHLIGSELAILVALT